MANKKNRKQSAFERLTSGKLNRRQRKDWELRLNSTAPQLEVIHADAAGIDIGNESHFAAVAPGKDPHPVREFGSWTGALHELAEWLQSCGVKTVAMQSTGVYWIARHSRRGGFRSVPGECPGDEEPAGTQNRRTRESMARINFGEFIRLA